MPKVIAPFFRSHGWVKCPMNCQRKDQFLKNHCKVKTIKTYLLIDAQHAHDAHTLLLCCYKVSTTGSGKEGSNSGCIARAPSFFSQTANKIRLRKSNCVSIVSHCCFFVNKGQKRSSRG
nr:PREDICTED: uncharacterized protein LOC103313309 isoform X2 [Tribolium castaneum]|eukprot:XP_015836215.1 PREDICTED: uncharacterized protein LOC103313309 isoform X2 [Tribolium castaneum]